MLVNYEQDGGEYFHNGKALRWWEQGSRRAGEQVSKHVFQWPSETENAGVGEAEI